MKFLSPKSRCQLCVAIDSTKPIYQRTDYLPAHSNYRSSCSTPVQSTRHTQSSAAERTCTASSVLVTVGRMFAGQSCPPSTQQKPYQPKQYHPTRGRCCCPRGVGPPRTQEGGERRRGEKEKLKKQHSTPHVNKQSYLGRS